MAKRKSIVLYFDAIEQWDMLSDAQAGILIKALLRYSNSGERLTTSDGMLQMAFSFMSAQIDRDGAKYDTKCEKNRQIAIEREEKKRAERERNNTNVNERERTYTKSTYTNTDTNNNTDTKTDTDTDIINNNKSSCNSEYVETHARPKKFVKPSLDQVKAYCKERNSRVNAERFYSYYESNGWKVGKNSMKDWKAAVRNWETNGYKNDVASDLGEDADKYYRVAMEAAKRDREETEQQFQEMRGYYG